MQCQTSFLSNPPPPQQKNTGWAGQANQGMTGTSAIRATDVVARKVCEAFSFTLENSTNGRKNFLPYG